MKLRFALDRKALMALAAFALLIVSGVGATFVLGIPSGFGTGDATLRGTVDGSGHTQVASGEKGHSGDDSSYDTGHDGQAKNKEVHEVSDGTKVASLHEREDEEAEGAGAVQGPPVVFEMPKHSTFVATVRLLLQAQTLAAHGKSPADASQRELLAKLQGQLQQLDPATASQKELDSLAVYLLSGGDPRGLTSFIAGIPPDKHMKKLLRGARAYVIGDMENARKDLNDLQDHMYSSALGARIQLVRSALATPEDLKTQTSALEKAAGLAPGTLIEEASLRRLLALALKSADRAGFVENADRYMRRFPKSLYIEDFITTFGQGVLLFERLKETLDRNLVGKVYGALPSERGRLAALNLARDSVDSGYRELCLYLTQAAFLNLLPEGPVMPRAELYAMACSLVDSPADVLPLLKGLDPVGLPKKDADLREDAIRMATAMLGKDLPVDLAKFQGPELPDPETVASKVSATQQLQVSEELLKKAQK